MCLAIPLCIVEKNGPDGVAEENGVRRHIRLDFVPSAQVGDYVIVHAGFAIERMGEQQAREDLAALREVADALG
jgi:hydrogenase expression/formation protein HypC